PATGSDLGGGPCDRVLGPRSAPRASRRAEHQPARGGKTQPASNRAVILDLGSDVIREKERESATGIQVRSLPVRLNAEYDIADLIVVAQKPSTDDAARVEAVGHWKSSSSVGQGAGRSAPAVTNAGT